ncbi:MAG: RtcB family protein, partial [Candidatus Heimdallarchaeaceae archaeon]
QKYSIALPDTHAGYGFPIGGVAAMDLEEGVISPGGIGFDINCGVRMIKTNLTEEEVRPKIKELIEELFRQVPAGVGVKGFVRLNRSQFIEVLENGAQWCLENGYAIEEDIIHIESNGRISEADTSKVSDKAIQRGISQLGTLGSGNHYLEIQVIRKDDIFDQEIAKKLGLDMPNQVTLMVHCGSRGFGHQIGTDYLRTFLNIMPKYKLPIIDKELASAPIKSREGENYYAAMSCAANMAFANRQVIFHRVREVFEKVFHRSSEDMGLKLIYDVAHNIAKIEEHTVDGKKKKLLVHRKGATRSFPPNHPEIPKEYQEIGQPVIIGGSMETASYLLVGTASAMDITFGSTAHGAGRTMSRSAAKRKVRGDVLQRKLRERGIYLKGASMPGIAEEAGIAYKDIDEVIKAISKAKISKPVVRCRPMGNIKG